MRQLLPRRPALSTLQPPAATIYLSRTHIAARRLHWSLVCIRLNRSLMRRPAPSTLISANILPKECCKFDRRVGEVVWGHGVAGPLIERRRRVEREQLKEKMRVWLERKASQIGAKRKVDGGVGVMVWRFSKKMKLGERETQWRGENPKKDKVSGLKRFWESINTGKA